MTGHGEDLANLTANVAKDVAMKTSESVSKAAGNIAKMLLEMLLMKAKNRSEKVKFGKTNLEEILKSGQDVKMITMKKEDVKDFTKIAKEYGIQFAVIGKKDKDTKAITFKVGDVERVEKALEKLVEIEIQKNQEKEKQNQVNELKDRHRNESKDLKEKQRQELKEYKNPQIKDSLEEDTKESNEIQIIKEENESNSLIQFGERDKDIDLANSPSQTSKGRYFTFSKYDATVIFGEFKNNILTDDALKESLIKRYKDVTKSSEEYEIFKSRLEKLVSNEYVIKDNDGSYSITEKGKTAARDAKERFSFTSYDAEVVFKYIENAGGKLSIDKLSEQLNQVYDDKDYASRQHSYIMKRLDNNCEYGSVEKLKDGTYSITEKGKVEAKKVSEERQSVRIKLENIKSTRQAFDSKQQAKTKIRTAERTS